MKHIGLIICVLQYIIASPMHKWFETRLDHTTYGGQDPTTFKIRYLVDTQYYRNESSGKDRPIFFYAGNEGSITGFYDNTGFVTTTLAE
jgi:hypothetical protein